MPFVLLTVTLLPPTVAPADMLMFAVIEVALFIIVEFKVIPAPAKVTVVPAINPVPVKFTFKVCP